MATAETLHTEPRAGRLADSGWAVVAAFGTYFCMYGFRKPFTAAGFEAAEASKALLVTAQVLGYATSKCVGIKVISETPPHRRAALIVGLIAASHAALLAFAVVPAWARPACLFANGLPLGMVFGLVLGFLEGRRHTEALAAGLCVSFIVADGFTKSVGGWLLKAGVTELWMPFVAGLIFAAPLGLFLLMLARVAPPTATDIADRSERTTMTREDRRAFFRRYAAGLCLITFMYVAVTILRSVRADFAPEVWSGLGYDGQPGVFTWSEMLVAAGVMIVSGSTVLIASHRRAFFTSLFIAVAGLGLVVASVAGLKLGWLGGFAFMVTSGLGLYLPYIAVHTTVFERMIALARDRGTIGYLMYLADSAGYLGYIGLMVASTLFRPDERFLNQYLALCLVVATAGVVATAAAARWFQAHASFRGGSA